MDYVVIGGDARLGWLARLLRQRGESVGALDREPMEGIVPVDARTLAQARIAVTNCPPKLNGVPMDFEELLSKLPEDARVYTCGPKHPDFDRRVTDLWADETLLADNAALTAEGAVAAAMRASDRAMRDMRCLVIGWGRVGRALTELLVGIGAPVTAVSRSESGRNRAAERGAEAVPTGELARILPNCDLVFNTAPSLVLDEALLERVNDDALLIDLASPPYGIDLAAAWRMGLRAWREPALPGRCCPRSAAEALLRAIDRHERGEGRG